MLLRLLHPLDEIGSLFVEARCAKPRESAFPISVSSEQEFPESRGDRACVLFRHAEAGQVQLDAFVRDIRGNL